MTDSRAAVGFDRLPWLPDEPGRPARRRASDLLGWAVAATLLVAGASYWLGTRSRPEEPTSRPTSVAPAGATMSLPEPRRVEPGNEIGPVGAPEAPRVRAPEVHPVASSSGRISRPSVRRLPTNSAARAKHIVVTDEIDRVSNEQVIEQATAPAAKPVTRAAPTENVALWPARQSAGASGRVVQIGAFGSRLQAKRGWWHMVRAYPGVRRLPAVVVESRNSRGRPFYRFQIGTTSQAHSEVLCQRMERIRFSCAVVGLPGARKAVER
jgi:hypothetical protein